MKWVISRFNHDLGYLSEYTKDSVVYDRSDNGTGYSLEGMRSIVVSNIGTDISDKFKFIIENYNHLPDVAVYTKANIFKYISKEEFDKIKDNKTFTPILTQHHKTYNDINGSPVCFYKDGLYYETNNFWYLIPHPARYKKEIVEFFGMDKREYNQFAPGSNYIIPKENILKHSKETYKMLKSWLDWTVYPGDAMLLERNLFYLWK